ncbi:hypothetical protein ACE1TH_15855 [Shouchella sp. JSM 1781072]|uniref:hypothetical protein n=1 Tax=Shouchella sp. JSM 1781072 TaxID=3344581 RepID=UPI0035C1D484
MYILNKKRNVTYYYTPILCFYLFTLICLYPFGVEIGGVSLRLSDLISLALVLIGSIYLLKIGKVKKEIVLLLIIAPFFLMELILPILGSLMHSDSFVVSSLKTIITYLPLIFLFIFYDNNSLTVLDKKIENVLKVALITQLIASLVQILVVFNYLPREFLIQEILEQWSVDHHYDAVDGVRASGLTNNGIELSMIGILIFGYFLSKLNTDFRISYLIYVFSALTLIILSTTRAAILAAVIIFLAHVLFSRTSFKSKVKTITMLTTSILVLFFIISRYLGLEELFYRFIRITEGGLTNDFSYNYRNEVLWPHVLEGLRSYPVGTLINPYNVFGVIDSGYLSYYAQGTFLFTIAFIILVIGCLFLGGVSVMKKTNVHHGLFLINIMIYVLIAMYFYNLMRLPIVIFFIMYAIANIALCKKKELYEGKMLK